MNLLEVMCHPDVDFTRTVSNDIIEILQVGRIEAEAPLRCLKRLEGSACWACSCTHRGLAFASTSGTPGSLAQTLGIEAARNALLKELRGGCSRCLLRLCLLAMPCFAPAGWAAGSLSPDPLGHPRTPCRCD